MGEREAEGQNNSMINGWQIPGLKDCWNQCTSGSEWKDRLWSEIEMLNREGYAMLELLMLNMCPPE